MKNENNSNINHPSYYNNNSLETIEVIKGSLSKEEYSGFLKGNILKYVSRADFKGKAVEDLEKAKWYLDELIKSKSKEKK